MTIHSTENLNYDNLITDATVKLTTGYEILAKGQKLKRGAVLGYSVTTDTVVLVNKGATDSSKAVYAILATDTDASDEAKSVAVYYSGGFNVNNLTFGGTDTAKDHKFDARMVSIYFNTPMKG